MRSRGRVSEKQQPVQKRRERAEVIECDAVPLERPRPRVQERRSFNLLWLIPIAIIGILVFKVLAIIAIVALIVFALPRLLPGGLSGLLRHLMPGNKK